MLFNGMDMLLDSAACPNTVRYRANAQRADFVHTHRASSSAFGNENYFPPIPIFSPAASPVLRSPSIYYSAYVCLYIYILI